MVPAVVVWERKLSPGNIIRAFARACGNFFPEHSLVFDDEWLVRSELK